MLPPAIEDKIRQFAQAAACGRSARSWAHEHDCDSELVRAWSILPEFDRLVDAHRVHVADQMVGKLMARAEATIDQIYSASQYGPADPGRTSAGHMLIDKWLVVSRRFAQTKKIAALEAMIDSWEKKTNGGRRSQTGPA
jgi:hypothetical protein